MSEAEERTAVERELAESRALVRELEAELASLRPVAAELRRELQTLRTGIGSTTEVELDDEAWPSTNGSGHGDPLWAGTAPPPPLPKPVVVPRLILETAFLVLAAAVSALADLTAIQIVGVMAGAWLIVALSEWAAFQKQRRWRLDEVAPLVSEAGSPAWYVPPVEQTALRPPDAAESHTVVSLPTTPVAEETGVQPSVALEETGELRPAKRGFWRRHSESEPADPESTQA